MSWQGEARTPTRTHRTAQLQETLDAVAVAGIGLQQLREPIVIDRRTGEGPADVLGHLVVAKAHGVGITERPVGDFVAGPTPHPGQGLEATTGLESRHTNCVFETTRPSSDRDAGP